MGYTKFHAASGIVLGSLPNILHHSEKLFHTLVILCDCEKTNHFLQVAVIGGSHATVSSSVVTLGHVVYLDGDQVLGKYGTLRDVVLIDSSSAYAEGYAS